LQRLFTTNLQNMKALFYISLMFIGVVFFEETPIITAIFILTPLTHFYYENNKKSKKKSAGNNITN